MVKTRVRTAFKKAQHAVSENDSDNARANVVKAISEMDKAVSKGIVHKNTAARKKSRLMKKLNAL